MQPTMLMKYPDQKGNNNTRPVWVGNMVYFLSDRDNKNMNVYSYNTASKEVRGSDQL